MTDATQWLIDLLTQDIAILAGGILVLIAIVELLKAAREWLNL